jgi:hypothetical protein
MTPAWLAAPLGSLQADAKFFRRTQRALASGLQDRFLLRLHNYIDHAAQRSADAVTEFAVAHQALRFSLESGLARDIWGVIQHAVNVVHQEVRQVSKIRGLSGYHLFLIPVARASESIVDLNRVLQQRRQNRQVSKQDQRVAVLSNLSQTFGQGLPALLLKPRTQQIAKPRKPNTS